MPLQKGDKDTHKFKDQFRIGYLINPENVDHQGMVNLGDQLNPITLDYHITRAHSHKTIPSQLPAYMASSGVKLK